MNKLGLVISFLMIFSISTSAQTLVPKGCEELQKIHDECLVKFNHDYFKEGKHRFSAFPKFDDKIVSIYIFKLEVSACAKFEGKVLYRTFKMATEDGGINILWVEKILDGKSVKTIAYNTKFFKDSYNIAVDDEITDVCAGIDTWCIIKCAGKLIGCILQNSNCGTDWICYLDRCGMGIWDAVLCLIECF